MYRASIPALVFSAAVVLSCRAHAAEMTLGTVSCPAAARTNTGCYCTNGCSVHGDREFPWQAPAFPPTPFDGSYVGSDTICAKVTIPLTAASAALDMATYLGIRGVIAGAAYAGAANNTEVTIWTAFTSSECSNFVVRAKALVAQLPQAASLYVNLCADDKCNTVNLPVRAPAVAPSTMPVQFPGVCPVANPNPTGCYCSVGCSVNGDTAFPWVAPSWPPQLVSASVLGSDTICAKVTVPILSNSAGVNFAAYLGLSGDVLRTGSSNFFGASPGQTVTFYTALTTRECTNFMSLARSVASTAAINTAVLLCNTTNCNSVAAGSVVGASSAASPVGLSLFVVLCMAMLWLTVA